MRGRQMGIKQMIRSRIRSIDKPIPSIGLAVCIGGFIGGIIASTLWVLHTTGTLKLLGMVFIVGGIGACAFLMSDDADVKKLQESSLFDSD